MINKVIKILFITSFLILLIVLLSVPMMQGTIDFLGNSLQYEKGHYRLTYSYRISAYLNRKLRVKFVNNINNGLLINYESVSYAYQGEAYFNPFVQQRFQREQIPINQDVFLNSMGKYVVSVTFLLNDASELTSEKLKKIRNSIMFFYNTNAGVHRPLWTITYYLIISISVILFSIPYYLFIIRGSVVMLYIFTLETLNRGFKLAEKYFFGNMYNFVKGVNRYYRDKDLQSGDLKKKQTFNYVISGLRSALNLQEKESFPIDILGYPIEFIYKKVLDLNCLNNVVNQVKKIEKQAEERFANSNQRDIEKFKNLMKPASEINYVSQKLNHWFTLIATGITIAVGSGITGLIKSWFIITPLLYSYILLNLLSLLYLLLHVKFKKIKNNTSLGY